MSIDARIDLEANTAFGRPTGDLTGQESRELVRRLRDEGLHAEADTLWSWVLRDSIRQLREANTKSRRIR